MNILGLRLEIKSILAILVGSFIYAVGMNYFVETANLYAGGVTGIAQLISKFSPLATGSIVFILNIPLIVFGWIKVGRKFTIYSFISVFVTGFLLNTIEIVKISDDILLNSVFGGVITGVGIGLMLKYGGSSGGLDILAMFYSMKKDKSIGKFNMILNGMIIFLAGLIFGWEVALYTIVSLYVRTVVIDNIHTKHLKLTVMIITDQTEILVDEIYKHLRRGIKRIDAEGTYTKSQKDLLLVVITSYELYVLETIISKAAPGSFVNVIESERVIGNFYREKIQ